MKSAIRIWICLDGFHHSLHHQHHHHQQHQQHQQHHATTQNTNNNLHNAIFPMFVLAWIPSCFKTCWKKQVQWVMLAKAFPRLVGRVKLVWTLCEFWWWKVQLEYGYVWTVFTTHFTISTTTTSSTSSTTQPHRIPTTTCAMFFFPCLFLHGFCSVLQHAERNKYGRLCWPRLCKLFAGILCGCRVLLVLVVKWVKKPSNYVYILTALFSTRFNKEFKQVLPYQPTLGKPWPT